MTVQAILVEAEEYLEDERATWTVDTQAPTAIISGVPDSLTNQTVATLIVSGEDVTYYKYKVETDMEAMVGNGGYSEEIPISGNGIGSGIRDIAKPYVLDAAWPHTLEE